MASVRSRPVCPAICVLLAIGGLVLDLSTAAAVPFVVDDTGVTSDEAPGNGRCADADGRCTLLAAQQETDALPGADIIALPPGTYGGQTYGFSDDVTIVGAGAGMTVLDGENAHQSLALLGGTRTVVAGLTIRNGVAGGGGAIATTGPLEISDCVFDGNTASVGGAIWSGGGPVTVVRTTFRANGADAGGAIFANDAAVLTVMDSTFAGNVGAGNGAAIHVQRQSTATLTNVTLSGNLDAPAIVVAAGAGTVSILNATITANAAGLTAHPGSTVDVTNSIIAGNTGSDCPVATGIVSGGGNVSSDASCTFAAGTDLENTDPLLGALADNGGPTETHALGEGSPALDTALAASCPASDQRGVSRPQGLGCDRGAYEAKSGVPPPTSTTVSSTSTTTTSTSTSTSTTTTSTSTSVTVTSTSSTATTVSSTSTTLPEVVLRPPGRKLLVTRRKSGVQRLVVLVRSPDVAAEAPCQVEGELVIEADGAAGPAYRVTLGADRWKPLKRKKPQKGCRYTKGEVVAKVVIKTGKLLKVVARSDSGDLGVPLATSDPRPVRFELRHGAVRHCVEFGVDRPYKAGRKLVSKRSSPGGACPASGPSLP